MFYTRPEPDGRAVSAVQAGNQLVIASGGGGATNLKGATVKADQVIANVGGNLNIQSLQDTSTYASNQQNIGGSLSVGYGKMSGSFSASQSKVDSNFNSVNEQSGIKTGDQGFQVKLCLQQISSTALPFDHQPNRATFFVHAPLSQHNRK